MSAPQLPVTAKVPADEAERIRIREDLQTTFFVEAAAGTGKTTALVGRIVAMIRGGSGELANMVAVTFTDKAAGEMKLRLRSELERVRAAEGTSAKERKRLERALAQLELARIGTIHGFCSDLLRENPVEAGVDPLFAVAPEEEKRVLLDQAFDQWLNEMLADPPEGVRRVLRRRPTGYRAPSAREMLRSAFDNLVEHRDFSAPWRRVPFDREAGFDALLKELEDVAALHDQALDSSDWLAVNLAEIRRFLDELEALEDVRGRDYDALEAELRTLANDRKRYHWHYKGFARKPFAEVTSRADVIRRRDAVRRQLGEVLERADADLAPCLREELRPAVAAYEDLKRRSGSLDFIDLLLCTRDLVRDDRDTRATLQARFSHFFVDEFQDTDPLQAEIVILLAADNPDEDDWRKVNPVPGKLFLVGDPKQSIYRFRRADVAIYEDAKQRLTARGAQVLYLSTSFRSRPALQDFVNGAFSAAMAAADDHSQAAYVPLKPWREDSAKQPAVVALPVPEPYGDYGSIVHWRISDSLAEAAGAFVHWLTEDSGWLVEEGGEQVPVRPRHVCILFRRFKSFGDDITRPYVRALETRRVPHVLVGGRSFHDREEVLALRNALGAIEWPDDELRVYATLRGPLFALGDDALLAWRHRHAALHPLRAAAMNEEILATGGEEQTEVDRQNEEQVHAALCLLAGLHNQRNERGIAETLNAFLAAVRAHAGLAIWPTGEQALANSLRMVDLARRFEAGGAASFRAFVERMEADAERGEAEDAPVVEEGTEGVRIMTAHKAKGLEFPVVVLADPICKAYRAEPGRHVEPQRLLWAEPLCGCAPQELVEARVEEVQRDRAEGVRIAYVAATRARDLLVVPAGGDAPIEGWLDVLDPALYPEPAAKRSPEVAPGCPSFGNDSVWRCPSNARRPRDGSVKPGLHQPRRGRHSVVWWDPAALALEVEERVGLRQMRILEADENGNAEQGVRAWEAWRNRLVEARSRASEPALLVESVTAVATLAAEQAGADVDAALQSITLEIVPADRDNRPGGKRFGTLVHAILEVIDLDADSATIAQTATAQARLIAAPRLEAEAAQIAVTAALAHPLMRQAAACAGTANLRRETPIHWLRRDGEMIEGIVDLAFLSGEGKDRVWTVVDFKTDRDLEVSRAKYALQLSLYAEAISAATGQAAHGVIFAV